MWNGRACRQAQRSRQFRKHLEVQFLRSKYRYCVPLILYSFTTPIYGIDAIAVTAIALLCSASREPWEQCVTFLTFLSTVERSISVALWGYHYILSKIAPHGRNDALPFKRSSAENTRDKRSSRRCRVTRSCPHRQMCIYVCLQMHPTTGYPAICISNGRE